MGRSAARRGQHIGVLLLCACLTACATPVEPVAVAPRQLDAAPRLHPADSAHAGQKRLAARLKIKHVPPDEARDAKSSDSKSSDRTPARRDEGTSAAASGAASAPSAPVPAAKPDTGKPAGPAPVPPAAISTAPLSAAAFTPRATSAPSPGGVDMSPTGTVPTSAKGPSASSACDTGHAPGPGGSCDVDLRPTLRPGEVTN